MQILDAIDKLSTVPPEQQVGYTVAAIGSAFVVSWIYKKLKGPSLHGDACFAIWRDIKKVGLTDGKGIPVGKYRGKILFYSEWFISLLAKTRAGKGAAIVITTLLGWTDSVIALDVKGENHEITSGFRSLYQPVYCFAPFSMKTHCWNPLEYIVGYDELLRIPEVMSVGSSIYPVVDGKDGIWNDTARNLFVGLALYLLETPSLPLSIGEMLRQVSGNGKTRQKHLAEIIKKRQKSDNPLSRVCVESLEDFVDAAPNTASSIMNTFTAPLSLWRSPVVDAATSKSDFHVSQVRRKRMSVYVKIPVSKLDESKLLINLFFSQVVKQNTDIQMGFDTDPDPKTRIKHKCLLLLDEALAPGFIPILLSGSAYIASYGMILVTIAQSLAQMATPMGQGGYGHEGSEALLANHGLNIVFPPKSDDEKVAESISKKLGTKTVWVKSYDRKDRSRGTRSLQPRRLMMAQEIQNMNPLKQFIFMDRCPPILCDRIEYYKERVYMDRLAQFCPDLNKMTGFPTPKKLLAKIRRLPTHDQLIDMIVKGKLQAPVPDLVLHYEKPVVKIVEDEPERQQSMDFSALPEIGPEPCSQEQAEDYINKLMVITGIESEAEQQA